MSSDDFEERLGNVSEPLRELASIMEELEKEPYELEASLKLAKSISEDLSTAETCEKEADFDDNIKAALEHANKLADSLRQDKVRLKREGEDAALEAAKEASASMRGLIKEIKELLPE